MPATPSGRQNRLPASLYGNHGAKTASGVDSLRQGTPHRQTFNNLDPNVYGNSNNPGYGGMSAGVKIGRQQNGLVSRNGIGVGRMSGVSGLNIR